ncbi:MAG: CinA family protein [Treponema sp.]|jgi:PncC family amidohydrolase|nr:CinA family protein [Treponema sp.]
MDNAASGTARGQAGAEARLLAQAESIIRRARTAGAVVVLAESCTGGLAADLLAQIPGASEVLWGSFVCYTPDAKIRMLGIEPELLRAFGLVSRETARAMAAGALEQSGADLAIAITGLAGPGGDGSGIPLGTIWIGSAYRGSEPQAAVYQYQGSRNEIRRMAARGALDALERELDKARMP